jgi:hypothetical protein
MLPLLELPTDCLLTLEKGRLRSGQKGVLNPFAYSTVEGVLTATFRKADSREWKIPLIGNSQEEKDFDAFVLVAETPKGRLQVIRTDETGKKMDKVVVVPGKTQDPIWICPDGRHLSQIVRVGDRVTATPVLLSAPFQDLVSWFRDLNGKIRGARALEWVRSAVLGTRAWAPELWEAPGDGRVYAQFRKETDWSKDKLDLGIASLHGVAAMGIPPAGEFAKAVLLKYVTVKADCFESMETALSRVKADTGDTTHVAGMLMKRAFVVSAHWRTRLVGDELHLHVLLEDPVKATQVLIREVPLADNAMSYLVRTVHSNPHIPVKIGTGRQQLRKYRSSIAGYADRRASGLKSGCPPHALEPLTFCHHLRSLRARFGMFCLRLRLRVSRSFCRRAPSRTLTARRSSSC